MGAINRILMRSWRMSFTRLLLALVASLSLGTNANPLQTYNEAAWQALNKAPAITSNIITSAVEYDGRLYITGQGLGAGSLSNQNIIAWDGDQWFAVPDPVTLNMSDNLMMASAVVHEGELVVSAAIDISFGQEIRAALYAWNGSAWRTLHEEPSMTRGFAKLHSTNAGLVVLSIPTAPPAPGVTLNMETKLWNGTTLSNMPTNGVSMGFSFATWQGQLYWAGYHQDTTASDSNAHYALLVWDGQIWKAVEHSKLTGYGDFNTQAVVSGNDLILAGSFRELNGVSFANVARWDGSAWHQLSGVSDPYINNDWERESVQNLQQVDGRLLILGRYFNTSSNEPDYKLSFWNGQSVEPLSEGVVPKGAVPFGSFWAHFQQQTLLFNVSEVRGTAVNSAAILGGSGWKAFDDVQLKTVQAMAEVNGRLAVAGLFSDGSHGVAWQEPSGWQQFGITSNDDISSLVEYQGNLIAAGNFTQIDGVAADSIALWNGTSWEAFASGLTGASISKVFVFNDQVYAAGTGSPFDVASSAVLYWDGNSWVAPETGGTTISPNSRIHATIEFNGQLVLGGNIGFATSSTPLVTWDGTTLAPFAPLHTGGFLPFYDWVSSLAVYEGELIAAVESHSAMPTPSMPYLAAWDGTSWNSFTEIYWNVVQVAVFDGTLMALVQSSPNNDNLYSDFELRSWDGQDWSGLTFDGYRLGFQSTKLMLAQDDLLVFAGNFDGVGFTDWSETENAVFSPGIIGLQSAQATLSFAGEGANGLAPVAGIAGNNIVLPDLQRSHYTFLGWNTAADGSGTRYKNTMALPYGTTTLYAEWTPVLYTLTFNFHGTRFELSSHLPGASIAAPSLPTRTGYTFINWDAPVPATMPAHNLTFTAQWQINTYTISFNVAGGNAIAPVTLAYGATVTLPSPQRQGYNFLGWNQTVPLTMPANDLTLTARWQAITHSSASSSNSSSANSSASSTPGGVSSSSVSSQSYSADNGGINSSAATSSSQAAESSSSSTSTQPVSSQASSSSAAQSSVSSSGGGSGGSGSSSLLLFAVLGLCLVARRSRIAML